MKSYRCVICGYIHVGNNPPETCPICGASSSEFEIYQENEISENEKMNIEESKIVIIGSGIAGLSCAEEIRNNSDSSEVILISEESSLPYYRLNLSRYIANEVNKNDLTIYPQRFYDEKKIKLILGVEVIEINRDKKHIKLNDEKIIEYDKLIITNGANPFVPPISGSSLKNVITVRQLKDADFVIEKMNQVKSCVCIGGGILGLEVAGAIAKSGIKVILLESAEWLMPRQLNNKASGYLKKYLEDIGVEVKENVKIDEIIGGESCEGVKISTGEVFHTQFVIITAGVRPNISLARKSGLDVNMGLIVNDNMKTSDENIFAAGDITEHNGILYGLWDVAQFQGKIAAKNAIGINTQFGGVPRSNILKVLGLDMFSIGEFTPKDDSYYQYEKETPNSYIAFVLKDDKIIGSIIIGDKALSIKVKQAVEKGINFQHELYNNADEIIRKLSTL